MIAVGVARPMAQGQAMTRTLMNAVSAWVRRGSGPKEPADERDRREHDDERDEHLDDPVGQALDGCLGALGPRTSSTIRASAVSRPTCVARMTKVPVVLSVAPMTSSPAPFATGIGSPVSIDSSTPSRPRRRCRRPGPSRRAGPGAGRPAGRPRAARRSPRRRGRRRAVVAWSPTSRRIAPVGLALGPRLQPAPSRTSPMIIADESK